MSWPCLADGCGVALEARLLTARGRAQAGMAFSSLGIHDGFGGGLVLGLGVLVLLVAIWGVYHVFYQAERRALGQDRGRAGGGGGSVAS